MQAPSMDFTELIRNLASLPTEGPCVEFKENKNDPTMIGKTISALSNSAALNHKDMAYMVWGIQDQTHDIVGTTFDPFQQKVGDEDLLNWLRKSLSKNMEFTFREVCINGVRTIILSITPPTFSPTTFSNIAYIRDGSHVTPLMKMQQLEKHLWNILNTENHELSPVMSDLSPEKIISLLDCKQIVSRLGIPSPTDEPAMIDILIKYGLAKRQDDGLLSVTMAGALLFARDLSVFNRLSKKTVRIIQYSGTGRSDIVRQLEMTEGYAIQFDKDIHDLELLLPTKQEMENGIMTVKNEFPIDAVREILANAMIHQDLLETGMYITVEIFDGRIEITNPGNMLVEVRRVVDSPSKSRNSYLPRLMREMGICEELGSGWDRIVESCESMQIPAPRIEVTEMFTRIVLLGQIRYEDMTREDRIWACYLHACSQHTNGKRMTNTTLRSRFGLDKGSTVAISRLLKSAIDAGLIKVYDDTVNPRNQSYVPYWA